MRMSLICLSTERLPVAYSCCAHHLRLHEGPPAVAVPLLSHSGVSQMIAFSMLVNFLGDAIDSRMEALFEGKSRVLEENFTLILGWSDKCLPLVQQVLIIP